MKFQNFVIVLSIILIGGMTQAAVIQVAEGTDVLSAAISSAADGDVIELTTDGGIYAETAKFSSIDFSISIVAAEGVVNKPIIRTPDADYMFKLTGKDANYVFKGLEIDGSNGTGSAVAKYFLRIDNADTTGTMTVSILDCFVHDFQDKHIKPYANSGIDELIVDNSIFKGGAREGIVLYTGSSSDPAVHLRKATITNSTFYDMKREAIKGQTFDSTKVLIDRCTFYDCGNGENKSMLYFRNMEDVEVKNSIFANNQNTDSGEEFADLTSSVSSFHHNVMWDIINRDVGNATVSDTLWADPGFADAANADFSLPTGSPLLTFADDGGAVGDPRWVPEPVVHQVAAGADVISAAISAAGSGDIIELTSDGGVYTESSKFSSVSKSLTIRAAEGMVNKPILRVATGGDYIFKLTGTAGTFVLDGIEVDGTNGTGVAENKYIMRIDNLDPAGTLSVQVLNCDVHDFLDKIIKVYPGAGVSQLIVDNCQFSNGDREGICLYDGSSSTGGSFVQFASITNSTFFHIGREAIKGEQYAGMDVVIDRCTFYDIGQTENKGMIRFRDTENVTIKNSIFQGNVGGGDKFVDCATAVSTLSNCSVWDVLNYDVGAATVTDTLHADPQFADAANGDFTIGNEALFTFADDGGAIGDPRWAPGGSEGFILKVEISGQGSVALDPDQPKYESGTSVTLTATPLNENWKFIGWSSNVSVFPPDNPVAVVTVNDNMLITAYFEPVVTKYENVVIGAVGLGHVDTVRFSDYAIPGFFEGDSVILTAVPDTTTWVFDYWANADSENISTDNPLTWIVDGDSTWIAMFKSSITQYSLTQTVIGLGTVNVTPQPVEGFTTYDEGTELTLIASAPLGWEFAGWSGDVTDTDDTVVVTLNADMSVTATFTEIDVPGGELIVDNSWDIRDALEFAKYNSQVKLIKLVTTDPFMPDESERKDGKLPRLDIDFPVTIVGADTMDSKAVLKGWGEGSSDGMIQFKGNAVVRLKNIVMDGYFGANKTKYIFRSYTSEMTYSLFAEDVEFFGTTEVFFKNYAPANVDTLSIVNCIISDIGKEGIYDQAAGTANYVEIRNTTFHHVARETFRFKTWSPKMIVDHVTVDSCGYGSGTEGDKFAAFKLEVAAPAVITNCIISNVPNSVYGYSVRMYGEEALIDNVLLHNAPRIDDNDGSKIGPDVFWYDPMFAYTTPDDFTLKDSSLAYHLANDGTAAIGDLRWATSTNIATYHTLALNIEGDGDVSVTPEPMAKFYIPGTVVSLAATPDSLSEFVGWSGDASGSDPTINITMDANKIVTATFTEPEFTAKFCVNMRVQMLLGNFNASLDTVDIAGSFGHMGNKEIVMSDDNADSIYCVEMKFKKLSSNRRAQFRFRINGVPEERSGDTKSGPDREVEVSSDTTFVFWYNDEDESVLSIVESIPTRYELRQNYPNPFNPTTTIEFALKKDGHTRLIVYDMLGREVVKLIDKNMKAGYHQVVFSDMSRLSSGVYIYKLTSGDFSSIRKMMLMK